jgi:RimJ/RimL family protein N-acetyltransferase
LSLIAETPRLRLRSLRPGDLEDLAAMFADPEQMRFWPAPRSRAESAEWLERNIEVEAAHGFGFWCVESRPDGAFVGHCGLRPLMLEGSPEVEVGWHLLKTRWNQGLATEAAQEAVRLGFERFGLARIVAIVPPANLASRRVAQKLGMVEERTVTHEGEPVIVHALAA